MEFSRAEIEEAVRDGRLLSLEIEMTRLCNLRCTYCYAGAGTAAAERALARGDRGRRAPGGGTRGGEDRPPGRRRAVPVSALRELIEYLSRAGVRVEPSRTAR